MIYFGTRERATWVKAPAPGAGFKAEGYSNKIDYANGGAGVRNSNGAHLEYNFSWNARTREEVAAIEDYAYNLYGDGLIYFLDPNAIDRNLFSAQWAAPKITAEDGIPLTGTVRPEKVLINDMSLGYPMYGAQYSISAGQTAKKFYVPIPDGYTAWVGAHGLVNSKGLVIQPTFNGVNSGLALYGSTMAVNNPTRFNVSVTADGSKNGIDISIDTSAAATITLAGVMCQVLPNGVTPVDGSFISGRGNSGCVFVGKPERTAYIIAGVESIGVTATLAEVGDWL